MVSTNLDTTLSTFCPAEVEEDGRELLPGRRLVDLVRLLTDSQVILRTNGESGVQLKSGSGRFRFLGPAADQFPSLPALPETGFEVSAQAFQTALRGIDFAISRSEERYNLGVVQGVLTRPEGVPADAPDRCAPVDLQLAATDGHRLAVAWLRGSVTDRKGMLTAEAPRQSFLVPHRGVGDLLSLLSDLPERSLQFGVGDRSLLFESGHRQLWVQQGSGIFPVVTKVLYPETPFQVQLPARELSGCLRRMLPVMDNSLPSVSLSFRAGTVELNATSAVVGDGVERLDIDFAGPSIRLRFNPHYLLDILDAVSCDFLTIMFKDEISAVAFEPVVADGGMEAEAGSVPAVAFRHVVMPLSSQAQAATSGA